MRKLNLLILTLFTFLSFPLISSAEAPDISQYLSMVASGKVNEVKSRLPDLLVDYPNDPGVQLLLGVCLDDAYKAIDIYTKITKDNPDSEWADDAYWRIVQFYAVAGDTARAKEELETFASRYPTSQYLIPAFDVVRSATSIVRAGKKTPQFESRSEKAPEKKQMKREEPKKMEDEGEKIARHNQKEAARPNKIESEEAKSEISNEESKHPVMHEEAKEEKMEKEKVKEEESHSESSSKKENPKVEKSESSSEPEAQEEVKAKSVAFGLQVNLHGSRENAEAEMRKYLKQRMRTDVKPRTTNGTTMYAVVVGNYSSRESAEAAKQIVGQQCGCEPVIIEK